MLLHKHLFLAHSCALHVQEFDGTIVMSMIPRVAQRTLPFRHSDEVLTAHRQHATQLVLQYLGNIMLRREGQTTLREAGLRFRSFSTAISSRPPDHLSPPVFRIKCQLKGGLRSRWFCRTFSNIRGPVHETCGGPESRELLTKSSSGQALAPELIGAVMKRT